MDMICFLKKIFYKFTKNYKSISALTKQSLPTHPYRVLSIEQDENDQYTAIIQIKNKNEIFRMKPEEILANDDITDSFSQRDIRMLTYLGYLGINSPKYKILAQRLSEDDSKLIFAIHERGKNKTIVKTASEISSNEHLIAGLHQKDAHMVGYATATEQVIDERKQKQNLISQNDSIC